MKSNPTLISIGQFDLKLNHLLIIGILSLSFSTSFLLRSQPAHWGWELNEFDPFFNYRATQFILENGVVAYYEWNDKLSWYPDGRDISSTSQTTLHLTAAVTYSIFAGGGNLHDFTILFPAIIGSLTCIVVFALVRVIGGTTAGLLASLFFSISLSIIIRGQIGWFKSEPLGLFFGLLSTYLFLSGIKNQNYKISFAKLVSSGFFLILGISAWGGNQFFIIPLGIFFFVLPIVRKDHKFLIWAIPLFTASVLIISQGIERLNFSGANFVTGIGGLSLLVPTIYLILSILVQQKSAESQKTRNAILFLLAFLIISSSFLIILVDSKSIYLPAFRYLNAVNPFLTTTDPLVDSVSEHATASIQQSFLFHSVLMIFAGLGIWLIVRSSKMRNFIKNDMVSFSLIFALVGVYASSTFIRLEVFASISVILLASVGLSIIIKEFLSSNIETSKLKIFGLKSVFIAGLIVLLISPLIISTDSTIFALLDNPPTILNGGTHYKMSSTDWNDSLEWIKNNTPKDAVIASWWDYGYWIQTKAERATLVDNSTLNSEKIKNIAKILLSDPDTAWKSLQDVGADYFVVTIAAKRSAVDGNQNQPVYFVGGGGDESKKQWFMRIAGEPLGKYLYNDGFSGTETFWNETLLGKMTPFKPIGYVNFQTNQQSLTYQTGFTGLYEKSIKFSENETSPMKLVYYSPSFDTEKGGTIIGVFVYEINDDYVPIS